MQTAVCTLNIALPENIVKDGTPYGSDLYLSDRSYSLPRTAGIFYFYKFYTVVSYAIMLFHTVLFVKRIYNGAREHGAL